MTIRDFLMGVDRAWRWPATRKIQLHLIGSTALMLQADYVRGTKDSDVLEVDVLLPEVRARLLDLAGKDSVMHRSHNLYLEFVGPGLPFLPQAPQWHASHELNEALAHFHVAVLDLVDVVVSKLARFNANDVDDVDAMVSRGLIDHQLLVARFMAAVDNFQMDARVHKLPTFIKNLHVVERDFIGTTETDVPLPGWIHASES